jgi:hypothetical protein
LSLKPNILALLVYLALATALFAVTWTSPSSRVIGAGPDPPVFLWYLRWIPFAISHGLNPLFTNYLDYPAGINLMWQTSIPLFGFLLWPLTVTAGPIFVYNLIVTASIALSGWCAYLGFRRHVKRAWAAAIGGALFGFSPYMVSQSLGHPHVVATFLCPLMLILFEEVVIIQRRAAWKLGLAAGIVAAIQLLVSEELLLTEVLIAAIASLILAAMRLEEVRPRARYVMAVLIPAIAVLLVIGGWPLGLQFLGPQAVHGTLPTSNVFVTDAAGLVLPSSMEAITPSWLGGITDRFSGTQYEGGAFLGLPLLAFLALGVWRHRYSPVVQLSSVLLALAVCLSLGVTLHIFGIATGVPAGMLALGFVPLMRLPVGRVAAAIYAVGWLALAAVPVFDNIVPSRLMLFGFLFAALLVSIFVDQLGSLLASGWLDRGAQVAAAMAGLAAVTLLPAVPFPSSAAQAPLFFTAGLQSRVANGAVVLVVPFAHDFESRAMLWQLSSGMWFRMPEGYANRPGPSLDPPATPLGDALIGLEEGRAAPAVTPAFRSLVLQQLRSWNIAAVVVGPMDNSDLVKAFLSAIIGKAPTETGGVLLWTMPAA